MKPLICLLIICSHAPVACGQAFSKLLIDGKGIIREERMKYGSEREGYLKAIGILERAAKLKPDNAEVHYFLGSAYDYSNSPSFKDVRGTSAHASVKASNEFEKVIKLAPAYKGDIIALDPYTKLSSIWGCLAFSYIVNNKKDSARWAFTEGKRRGAFSEFALKFYRQVLKDCEEDGIFLTCGDNSTMNIWYLQEMENLRPDVASISLSVLDIPWVTEYYLSKYPFLLSSPTIAADTTPYFFWEEQLVDVPVRKTGKMFSWTVKPTEQEYIFRRNNVFMDMVVNNKFTRPVYYEKGCDYEILNLDEYGRERFLDYEVLPELTKNPDKGFLNSFKTFPFGIIADANVHSDIERTYVYMIRYNFMKAIKWSLANKDKAQAWAYYDQMIATIPLARFPYENKDVIAFIADVKEKLR